jgi:peptidoglycan L-alanyl-D-glutamate endopeptidase CwlK
MVNEGIGMMSVAIESLQEIRDNAKQTITFIDGLIDRYYGTSPEPVNQKPAQDYPIPERESNRIPAVVPSNVLVKDSRFKFGAESIDKLAGCHPVLRYVAERAIQITSQDFGVFEGLRTIARQQQLVERGQSRTMNSKHLIHPDGFSHAYDLVPWIGGKFEWDWDGCFRIVCAVDQAATELGHAKRIRWGGAWDRTLADFGNEPKEYAEEVQAYRKRRGGKVFLDGVHFELIA